MWGKCNHDMADSPETHVMLHAGSQAIPTNKNSVFDVRGGLLICRGTLYPEATQGGEEIIANESTRSGIKIDKVQIGPHW